MDIPVELFLGFIGITLIMTVIGLMRDPRIPLVIMVAGMFIFPFVAITDKIIMGYETELITNTSANTTSNATVTSYTYGDAKPIYYDFTEYPKLFFGIYGSGLIFLGAIVYYREK